MVKEQKWLVIVIQHVLELVKWHKRSLQTSFTLACPSSQTRSLFDIPSLRESLVYFIFVTITAVCCLALNKGQMSTKQK